MIKLGKYYNSVAFQNFKVLCAHMHMILSFSERVYVQVLKNKMLKKYLVVG